MFVNDVKPLNAPAAMFLTAFPIVMSTTFALFGTDADSKLPSIDKTDNVPSLYTTVVERLATGNDISASEWLPTYIPAMPLTGFMLNDPLFFA